jgi:hypothetical protein
MTRKLIPPFVKFVLFVLIALSLQSAHAASQTVSEGTYIDAKGDKHLWHINDAHALVWGGQPYLPAGGVFQSRYLSGSQTDEEWNADETDLKTLKAHGVTDILLTAGNISRVPPEALQRLLDYLEANGFTYGLDINGFPRSPLTANIISPAIYRAPAPEAGAQTSFRNIGDLSSAKYFLVSIQDGSVVSTGDADVTGGHNAIVTVGQGMGGDGTVLLLYPQRSLGSSSMEGKHLPDIWSNADTYRDQLLLYLSHIHFGKGLRFFVDPIVDNLGFFGEAGEGFVPDSDAYRFQFQVWLLTRYGHNLGRLNSDWSLKDDDVPDFSVASRCVPLWYGGKGIGILLDPRTGKQYAVDPANSKVWTDIQDFKVQSVQQEMNGLADSLKSAVADVPVIYRWSEPSGIFLNSQHGSGFDGLLISTEDHGDNIADNAAGFACADAEQAGRAQWLLAELTPRGLDAPVSAPSAVPDTSGTAPAASTNSGYTSQQVLTEDRSSLQNIGVKGFYVNALRRLPDTEYSAINLLDAPAEQLDWLHTAAANMSVEGESFALRKPSILFYPTNISLSGTEIRQMPSGVWWLPSEAPGKPVDLGPGLEGYEQDQPSGTHVFVIWSPDGAVSRATFTLPKGSKPFLTSAQGAVITVLQRKGSYTFPISIEPEELAGVDSLPIPDGAVNAAFKEVARLIALGQDDRTPMEVFTQRVEYIRNSVLLENTPASNKLAYDMLRDTILQLNSFLSPYSWIEGEDSTAQNLGAVVSSDEASGHAYLWLDSDNPPPADVTGAYHADYAFNITAPGDYTIWASLAPGPPGVGTASPISYSIDGGTAFNVLQPLTSGPPYGTLASAETATKDGQFSWCNLGSQQLTPGKHTLSILVTGKAPSTGRYTMGIDCLCVTRSGFRPNGTRKPSLD